MGLPEPKNLITIEHEDGSVRSVKEHSKYGTWIMMRQRCNNPNHVFYCLYGGRGIKVCERWGSFQSFIEDMGPCPEGYTLDRIDGNGDYEPGNCRWVDWKTQGRNRRNLKLTEAKARQIGSLYQMGLYQHEIADMFGVSRNLISYVVNGKRWG